MVLCTCRKIHTLYKMKKKENVSQDSLTFVNGYFLSIFILSIKAINKNQDEL